MTRLTLSPDLHKQLLEVQGTVEIVDEAGKKLGTFRPTSTDADWEDLDITEEEIQRRLNEPGRMSLTEIMRDLEKLK